MTASTTTHASQGFSLRNVKTLPKLLGAFGIVCLLMVLIGGIGIWAMTQINASVATIADQDLPKVVAVSNIRADVLKLGRDFRQVVLDPDTTTTLQDLNTTSTDEQTLKSDLNNYALMSHSTAEQQSLATLQDKLQGWLDTYHQMIPIAQQNTAAGNLTLITTIHGQWLPQSTAAFTSLDQLIASTQSQIASARVDATNTVTRMLWSIVAGLIVATGLAFWIGLTIARQIAGALTRMADVTEKVAEGDLSRLDAFTAHYGGKAESGQLAYALGDMVERLRDIVGRVIDAANGLAGTSAQIAESAEQSGSATEQVSRTIQQVAMGVQDQANQLTAISTEMETLKVAGDHVAEAAAASGRVAEDGARVIKETLTGMQAVRGTVSDAAQQVRLLAERSQAISAITTAIADIADQTNLLALNAAIEAARAGEHGRGFAVVADEVRKLAERSSMATQDITKIIDELQHQMATTITTMESGVADVASITERSGAAGEALGGILTSMEAAIREAQVVAQSAQRATDAVTSVASVSEENSAAAEEVSAATEQMSAQVEETVAATQMLNDLSEQLRTLMSVFSLGADVTDLAEQGVQIRNRPVSGNTSSFKRQPTTLRRAA